MLQRVPSELGAMIYSISFSFLFGMPFSAPFFHRSLGGSPPDGSRYYMLSVEDNLGSRFWYWNPYVLGLRGA